MYVKSYYFTSQEEDVVAKHFMDKLDIQDSDPIIAIAPGGGKNVKLEMPNKRWPKEYYVGLIQKILMETPNKVLLFGSPDEYNLISYIRSQCPDCHIATSLTLGVVASIFRRCSLFIGNDSGPLHIASAMDIPTLSFYGPTNPNDWAPPDSKNTALYKKVECSPCYNHGKFPPCDHLTCLRSITIEEAWEEAKKHLQPVQLNSALP